MRPHTRFALITAVLAAAVTAMPAAYVLNGPKWGTRTVNYYINPTNADVSAAAAEAAVQVGAATWGSQSAADFRFYYMGRTNGTSLTNNGKNEVFFRNVANGGLIAETYWWADSGGHLVDADIVFYDGGVTFFTGSSGCANGIYIEDTAAHEFGHALGLGHSADPDATMYYMQTWCSTSGRTLNSDDLAGVEKLYPANGAPKNAAPSVSLTSPIDGAVFVAPATVAIAASASDSDGSVARVDFVVNGSIAASDTTAPYTAAFTNLAAGSYTVSAVATDNAGATSTSSPRSFTVSPAAASSAATVAFVKSDTTTQGTWKGAYGGEGYAIVADSTSLPSYAQVTASGQSTWTWAASTADVRALQRAAGTDRVMAAWYGSAFSIDVNVTGTLPRQLALYAADYDGGGRQQRVDLIDVATGALLDSRTMSSLSGGQYLAWNVLGHVTVQVTCVSGPNALVSGIMLGAGAVTGGGGGGTSGSGGTVGFVKTDGTTQGTWKGTYGSEGYAIASDSTSLPSDVQLAVSGQSLWTWAASTSDVRALQRAGTDRVMAAWYGSAFSIDLNVGGTQPRQIAIYSADYDNSGRQQRFDLIDASTGAVLDSRTISAFGGGQYVVWNVQGHVLVQVTRLSGPNALVSGVLIGGSAGSGGGGGASASAVFLTANTVTQGAWKGTFGSEGFSIAADTTSLPAYAQLTLAGNSSWTWAASTTDVRALQRSGSGRVMAAWYGTGFTIDLNVTDGQAHQIAIYSADYDNWGRQQRFDLVDAATGAVLDSRTMSGFGGGQYLVWNVQGHIAIQVTKLAGPNALVSGAFFK
jgi:Bacterial Ig domain/Matrixin